MRFCAENCIRKGGPDEKAEDEDVTIEENTKPENGSQQEVKKTNNVSIGVETDSMMMGAMVLITLAGILIIVKKYNKNN